MLDYENVNVNTIASNFNLSDTVKLQSMSLTSIGEDPEGNLETGEKWRKGTQFLPIPPPLTNDASRSTPQASALQCTSTSLTIATEKSPPFPWTYWTRMIPPMSF